ncbi:unnamed protein product [Effrenium voratum]|nr:unnamed protein product [Effrenium voratum]
MGASEVLQPLLALGLPRGQRGLATYVGCGVTLRPARSCNLCWLWGCLEASEVLQPLAGLGAEQVASARFEAALRPARCCKLCWHSVGFGAASRPARSYNLCWLWGCLKTSKVLQPLLAWLPRGQRGLATYVGCGVALRPTKSWNLCCLWGCLETSEVLQTVLAFCWLWGCLGASEVSSTGLGLKASKVSQPLLALASPRPATVQPPLVPRGQRGLTLSLGLP